MKEMIVEVESRLADLSSVLYLLAESEQEKNILDVCRGCHLAATTIDDVRRTLKKLYISAEQ